MNLSNSMPKAKYFTYSISFNPCNSYEAKITFSGGNRLLIGKITYFR
jgi:hypothetical protein